MNAAEIAELLEKNHRGFVRSIGRMREAEFLREENGKWSPSLHMDHLYRSVRPVLLAMAIPPFFYECYLGAQAAHLSPMRP